MADPIEISIPHHWEPRGYQKKVWNAMMGDPSKGIAPITRACIVWHRRAGKDLFGINLCASQAFMRKGLYWHMLPTYAQGRKVVWEGMTKTGRPFLDHFPKEVITRKRDDEMRLWLSNGSQYQVVGAEDPDRLVGSNPVGVVISEWSVMKPGIWDFLRPILAENDGWVIFIFTPRARNFAYRTLKLAEENPDEWFSEVLSVEDTGAVPMEMIEADRRSGMPEEMIAQEYFCSFEAANVGAFFGQAIRLAETEGRIADFPWNPRRGVLTAWDLGVGDMTSIWFLQKIGERWVAIDYYESQGKGLDHYHKILREKPYAYDEHLWPWDAGQVSGATASSWESTGREMGLYARVVPKSGRQNGIDQVRLMLATMKFDENKCSQGIEGLRQYTKKRLEIVGRDGEVLYSDEPVHSWASHPADALRTFAVGHRDPDWGNREGVLAPELAIV